MSASTGITGNSDIFGIWTIPIISETRFPSFGLGPSGKFSKRRNEGLLEIVFEGSKLLLSNESRQNRMPPAGS